MLISPLPRTFLPTGFRFQPHVVKKVLQECIDAKLKGFSYDPSRASTLCKQLSNEIIYAVKNLGYNRYKLVVQVIIGQKKGQTTRVLSRCLWDAKADNVATLNYENKEMYAVLQVFGLYHE